MQEHTQTHIYAQNFFPFTFLRQKNRERWVWPLADPCLQNTKPEEQDQPLGLDIRVSPCKQVRIFPREDSVLYLRSGTI